MNKALRPVNKTAGKHVHIYVAKDVLADLDRYACEFDISRSAFIAYCFSFWRDLYEQTESDEVRDDG